MALQRAVKEAERIEGFKFLNKGDTLKGYYKGQVTKTINGTPAVEHSYRTAEGMRAVLGQANILSQLKLNGIEVGTYVEIVFSGQMKRLKNGRTMKVYDVSFDRDNVDTSEESISMQDDDSSDEDLFEEPADEVPPAVAVAPPRPASIPTPERRARMQALLRGSKTNT